MQPQRTGGRRFAQRSAVWSIVLLKSMSHAAKGAPRGGRDRGPSSALRAARIARIPTPCATCARASRRREVCMYLAPLAPRCRALGAPVSMTPLTRSRSREAATLLSSSQARSIPGPRTSNDSATRAVDWRRRSASTPSTRRGGGRTASQSARTSSGRGRRRARRHAMAVRAHVVHKIETFRLRCRWAERAPPGHALGTTP